MSSPRPAATSRALACLLALLMCACGSLAPPGREVPALDIPSAWSAADSPGAGAKGVDDASLTRWWQWFDDPRLSDIVQRALQDNTRIVAAQATLRQAQALRDVAAAGLAPALDATASAQRGTAGGRSTGNRFNVGLGANWVPDAFGALRAAVDAGDAAVQAGAASLGDTQVQVVAEVALQYIVLRKTQARLALADDNLASQQETLQITDWRRQAGLVSDLEVDQARTAVEQTRALRPALQTLIAQSRHALAVLAGRPPEDLAATGDGPGDSRQASAGVVATVPMAREEMPLGIPAETLRQRADVRAAEYQVAAALSRVGQAQAQRWPSFAIGGSLGLSAISVGALGNAASVLSSVLASVSLPVFDGGAGEARVRSQQAALDEARQTYRAAVLGALQDVENALVALRGDRLRLASLRVAAQAAGQAALLARQRFAGGLVDFQVVLETQRTEFNTQDAVLSSSADIGNDQVNLFKALGGGWRMADAALPPARPSSTAPDR